MSLDHTLQMYINVFCEAMLFYSLFSGVVSGLNIKHGRLCDQPHALAPSFILECENQEQLFIIYAKVFYFTNSSICDQGDELICASLSAQGVPPLPSCAGLPRCFVFIPFRIDFSGALVTGCSTITVRRMNFSYACIPGE